MLLILVQQIGRARSSDLDGDLMILNSALKPNIKVTFIDIIPVSLSGFKFDSTQTDVAYISATASFKYFGYTYERL